MSEIILGSKSASTEKKKALAGLSFNTFQSTEKLDVLARDLLLEVVDSLPSKALRAGFAQKDIPTSSLMEVLKLVSPEVRKNFTSEMMTLALTGEVAKDYVEGRLSKLLKYSEPADRADLISNLIHQPLNKNALQLAEKILRISPDLLYLGEVIKRVGVESLVNLKRPEFNEYMAQLGIGLGIREAHHPALLLPNTTRKVVISRIEELKEALSHRLDLCDSFDRAAKSKATETYRSAAEENIKYLNKESKRCESVAELRELANRVIIKSAIEGIYCISLSAERDKRGCYNREWEIDDLYDIAKVLNNIGEGRILFTPLLSEISRVSKIEDQGKEPESESDAIAFAVRHFKSGRIDVSDDAIKDQDLSKKYDGVSSLQVALAHEIGHSLQLGRESSVFYDTSTDKISGPADSLYDFSRWLELSGWTIFDSKRVQLKHDQQAVLIDQKYEFPLGSPVQYQKEWVILRWDSGEKALYAHRFDAEFSLRDYSKTSPWEDWAEAFAEYIVLPKRLATYAPKKFLYFEDQFSRYHDSAEMLRVAYDSLKAKAAASQPANYNDAYNDAAQYEPPAKEDVVKQNPHRDQFFKSRFEALTHKEQSWILANMLAKHEDTSGLGPIYAAYQTFKQKSADQRAHFFMRLLHDPETHTITNEKFLDTKRKYLPALLAALNGIQQGDEIALLTARSSKNNNRILVETVERFLNHKIADNLRFFPNDPLEREKSPGKNTAERKLEVLKDLLNRYEKVIFYDDEEKNLKAVEYYARAKSLQDRLKVIDARKIPSEKMWESLLEKFEQKNDGRNSRTIRVFDIDGTLVNLEAKIYLIDKNSGTKLRTMTQEEFSHKTELEWLEQGRKEFSHADPECIALDFGDFVVEERVKDQLDLQMFQRQRRKKAA